MLRSGLSLGPSFQTAEVVVTINILRSVLDPLSQTGSNFPHRTVEASGL
jgi:hypothetical protein